MSITHTALNPETLLAALQWRYATKKFDPAKKIDAAVWSALEDALVLSPSSYGLQAWKFFVIDDPKIREQLKPASYNQTQITDASKLVVFTVKHKLAPADIDRYVELISDVRRVPKEALAGYHKAMLGSASLPKERVDAWLTRQVFIALGFFLTSAAVLGVDACPMEGFDKEQYDKILGLPEKGWNSVVVATAGYRAAEDAGAKQPKVRYPKSQIVEHI